MHWKSENSDKNNIHLINNVESAQGGDILFLISCSIVVRKTVRDLYKAALVIHASNLPKGRGWSPHIWKILENKNSINLTLLEAEDEVDSGLIWSQVVLELEGHELYDEINKRLFTAELKLMDYAITHFNSVTPYKQPTVKPTYYRARIPGDSELDINKSIKENFNLLRVSDPVRFPAFFYYMDNKYKLKIEKIN